MFVTSVNSVQSLYALQLAQARERSSEPVSTLRSSWGADTVTLSAAAQALLGSAGNAAAGKNAAVSSSALSAGFPVSGDGLAAVFGAKDDLADELQALGLENAGQFSALLDKLRSGDPKAALDALAQITGKPAPEIREALSGMPDNQLAAFVSRHTGLTARESAALAADLRTTIPGNA